MRKPLIEMDLAIDDIIMGLNFLTQELPNDVIQFIEDALEVTDHTIDIVVDNSLFNISTFIPPLSLSLSLSPSLRSQSVVYAHSI